MVDKPQHNYNMKEQSIGLLGNALQYGGILLGVHGVVEANVNNGITYMFLGGGLYLIASQVKIFHDVKVERLLLSQLEERLRANDKESKE